MQLFLPESEFYTENVRVELHTELEYRQEQIPIRQVQRLAPGAESWHFFKKDTFPYTVTQTEGTSFS